MSMFCQILEYNDRFPSYRCRTMHRLTRQVVASSSAKVRINGKLHVFEFSSFFLSAKLYYIVCYKTMINMFQIGYICVKFIAHPQIYDKTLVRTFAFSFAVQRYASLLFIIHMWITYTGDFGWCCEAFWKWIMTFWAREFTRSILVCT